MDKTEALLLGQVAKRAAEEDTSMELPGIVWLEHINIVVGDRTVAESFYFAALGCTQDANGIDANIGQQQFHIGSSDPTAPQVLAGSIGLAMPNLEALRVRLQAAKPQLDGTKFGWEDYQELVRVICPWGNTFLIWDCLSEVQADSTPIAATSTADGEDLPKMARMHLGIDSGMAVRRGPTGADGAGVRFVHFRCNNAHKCAGFYKHVFGSPVHLDSKGSSEVAAVAVGPSVHLLFSSGPEHVPDADVALASGIHICIYISNFATAFSTLQCKQLIWTNPRFRHLDQCDTYEQAVASRQFRFRSLVDLTTGEEILELEHETRTVRHCQFLKHVRWEPCT
mmetsp:Transcript_55045/g.109422  ORF Transcript_55045/g.109422 Transcript_55045/m.109422 type:complete len:339 (+) Transcript_55045:57-1073(+)